MKDQDTPFPDTLPGSKAVVALGVEGDDILIPFTIEALDVRGRLVRMGNELDILLERHDYPDSVRRLVGEACLLAALLGSAIKSDGGRLILQTQTDGPVSLIVADYRAPGLLRATARFDKAALDALQAKGQFHEASMLGKGALALTMDPGYGQRRYQGIVPLEQATLEEAIELYFRQSEQIPTQIRIAVAESMRPDVEREDNPSGHQWRGGGIMVQFLPDNSDRIVTPDLPAGDVPDNHVDRRNLPQDEAWAEAESLVLTLADDELTDPTILADTLLYRLFHERGVRVFAAQAVQEECTCSRFHVLNTLKGLSNTEKAEMISDKLVNVTCDFCNRHYSYQAQDLEEDLS
jgi:molecular chaperone Hsp33